MDEIIDMVLTQSNYEPINISSNSGLKKEEKDKAMQILLSIKMRGRYRITDLEFLYNLINDSVSEEDALHMITNYNDIELHLSMDLINVIIHKLVQMIH